MSDKYEKIIERIRERIREDIAEYQGTMSLCKLGLEDLLNDGDGDPVKLGEMAGDASVKLAVLSDYIRSVIKEFEDEEGA